MKKNFLPLKCSNVLLIKYQVLLYEPKIEFNILAGGKALATNHRAPIDIQYQFKQKKYIYQTSINALSLLVIAISINQNYSRTTNANYRKFGTRLI